MSNKLFTKKVKAGFLIFAGCFFSITATMNPFQNDQSREFAGYLALLIAAGCMAVVIDFLVTNYKESRNGKNL